MRPLAFLGFSASLLMIAACGSSAPKAPDKLKIVAAPTSLPADSATASTITVTATSSTSTKLTTGNSASLTTDNGFFTTKGTTTVSVDLTGTTSAVGTVQFFCTSDSAALIKATMNGTVTSQTTVTCGAGAPSGSGTSSGGGSASSSTIAVTSSSQVVAESNPITITATLTNSDGTPVSDGTNVQFTASAGTWAGATSATSATTKGVATSVFTAPGATGPIVITATFTDGSKKTVSATLPVQVVDSTTTYVVVSSDQSQLTATGSTATISATAYLGANPAPNQLLTVALTGPNSSGTFLVKSGGGTVAADSRSITGITTDSKGQIQVTFIAGVARGAVTITVSDPASAGSVSGSTIINISLPLSLANAAFGAADFTKIRVRGSSDSANPSVAHVSFTFTDQTGQPAADGITVNFEVTGTHSAEVYVDPAVQTTAGGTAATFLNAGTQAETVVVRATATYNGVTVSAVSPSIAIVGGLPEYSHMSISCDAATNEAPGLAFDNIRQGCTVTLADRFSNRVAAGTQVNFRTEAGSIENTIKVLGDDSGVSPTLVSGDPRPRKFYSFYAGATRAKPRGDGTAVTKVQELLPEADNLDAQPVGVGPASFYPAFAAHRPYPDGTEVLFSGLYPTDPNPNQYASVGLLQTRGYVTVIAVTQGEESFIDANGNKQYDVGEAFIDLAEPFIDKNDNGVQDDCGVFNTTTHKWDWSAMSGIHSDQDFFDCHEDFIDLDGDGKWTPGNHQWDASTSIWKSTKLLWTSRPYISLYPATLKNGGATYVDNSGDLFDASGAAESQTNVADMLPVVNPDTPLAIKESTFAAQAFIIRLSDINQNCPDNAKYGYTISRTNSDGTANTVGGVTVSGSMATYVTTSDYAYTDCDYVALLGPAATPPTVLTSGSLDVTASVPPFNSVGASWPITLDFH